ncbi:TetR/AcrR family transcriptional regulator [Kutzneria sp. NPDC052558]|uniref:TetR/AcrR family transcriptional regulator n=1 Tax=Kutzneria sp. NPDC052558 TaxID=3364121 RepID=UPI0037CAF23B
MVRRDTRQRIQDAALAVFAERGFEQATLREIAERLEITRPALYYHFKTKEEILDAAMSDLLVQLDDMIAWAEGQPREIATYRELLTRFALLLIDRVPLVMRLMQAEGRVRSRLVEQTMAVLALLTPPDPTPAEQLRARGALTTVLVANAPLPLKPDVPKAERARMAVEIAVELLDPARAHAVSTASHSQP